MMTLTSTSKLSIVFLLLAIVGMASGSHFYEQDQGFSIGGADAGFSVPEYESNAEIATELVAPFLFLTIILRFGFQKVLLFSFASEEHNRHPYDFFNQNARNFSREATLMALTVTAMLIPTPFWQYVRWAASSLGLIATGLIVLVMLFLVYKFITG